MNELTPAAVIVEAHRTLKRLLEGSLSVGSYSSDALNWLSERHMVEPLLDEAGHVLYSVTTQGRTALLGRMAA